MINIGMEVWYVNTKPVGVTGVITDVFTYPGDVDHLFSLFLCLTYLI